jgi:hypothetical protein
VNRDDGSKPALAACVLAARWLSFWLDDSRRPGKLVSSANQETGMF